MTMVTRREALSAIGTAAVVGLAGCSGDGNLSGQEGQNGDGDPASPTTTATETPTPTAEPATVRAAWVCISPADDAGWSWAHDRGRQAIEQKYEWLETAVAESVSPDESKTVMAQYFQEGFDIVFGASFAYMEPMAELAENMPDGIFELCGGYETHANLGQYYGRMYEARYLAGVAAGMLSERNQLGYVAARPVPPVVRGINAFTIGARSVNPEVETIVRWTDTWSDPLAETRAAESLVEEGVDVIANHQNSPAAVKAAANADIWSIGNNAPMNDYGGDRYITSPIWQWEAFYDPTVVAVQGEAWEPSTYWEGLETGMVGLSEWGGAVPGRVKERVSEHRSEIETGRLDIWAETMFEGKSDDFLFREMRRFVEGVQGEVPS